MTWTIENGYAPQTYDELLTILVKAVNDNFGTNYTHDSIVGTNFFKVYYPMLQLLMQLQNDITTLTSKLVDYLRTSDEEISIPKSSPDGIKQLFKKELHYDSSYKPIMSEEDAGFIHICVDVDKEGMEPEQYEAEKKKILDLIGHYGDGSSIYRGTEAGKYTSLNGQQFDVAFFLPTERPIEVKIVVDKSDNSNADTLTPQQIVEMFKANFAREYALGFDFEPQRYLTISELPYAAKIDVSYSEDGGVEYKRDVLQAQFNEKIILKKVTAEETA